MIANLSSRRLAQSVLRACVLVFLLLPGWANCQETLSNSERALVDAYENQRIKAIQKVIGSVVAVYGDDRQGGGSGVIIDPSGIALTNHHVIIGAGVQGWGGLADGNLYRWRLIGTDPGGDVAIIQMEGQKPFPYSKLGDSDDVRVGDWAIVMGNPFILTEDQKPTITLGIVSGVKRYQPGAGANQLVYGNCIQVDSSINPGNSGGPLFNLDGEVIGINGRGSFKDRGRVNVGLGYAISSNQIKNFVPDLLATKLVEHGTLDASFSDRDGKVVCSTINQDAPIAAMGVELGDELLEFEGIPIRSANQYTNLVCTLPEDWPAQLRIRSAKSGETKTFHVRMFGLPYSKPRKPQLPKGSDKPNPEQEKKFRLAMELYNLLASAPGTIRSVRINRHYVKHLLTNWRSNAPSDKMLYWQDKITDPQNSEVVGEQEFWLDPSGKFRATSKTADNAKTIVFNGNKFFRASSDKETEELTLTQAKLDSLAVQALGVLESSGVRTLQVLGRPLIDGGDKSDNVASYRIKYTDADNDWFYIWLNQTSSPQADRPTLSKAAPDKNCDQNAGGVLFRKWVAKNGWQIPQERHNVWGLQEKVLKTFQLTSTKVLPSDDAIFVLNEDSSKDSGQ